MFKRFKYNVRFVNPARTFSGDINFEEGLTAIVGPNGKGKSLILELMQYALHGSSALRGKADDYLDLKVELEVIIKGEELAVERSPGLVRLTGAAGPMATGTKPVNLAILRLFGYSSDVFKVANLAEQGEIEKLGAMKPTERKKLVDEVIGLTALDALTDFIQKEITSENAAVNAMEGFVKEVKEPIKENGLLTPAEYSTGLVTLQAMARKREVYDMILARPNPVLTPVVAHEQTAKLPELEAEELKRQVLIGQAVSLTAQLNLIPATPPEEQAPKLHEKDDQYEILTSELTTRNSLKATINALSAEEVRIPFSDVKEETLVAEEAATVLYNRWVIKNQLKHKSVPHDCPKCQHHWEDEDQRIKGEFGDVPDEEPPAPLTAASIATQRALIAKQPRKLELQEEIKKHQATLDAIEDPTTTLLKIALARKEYKAAEEHRLTRIRYVDLKYQMAEVEKQFNAMIDNTALITDIKQNIRALEIYQQAQKQWLLRQSEIDDARKCKAEILVDLDKHIEEAHDLLQKAHAYLNEVAAYEKEKAEQEKLLTTLNERKATLADWKNGKAAVVELRTKVKGYILPALNMVSSALLNEMTGGELTWVNINDEFDILVEGQRLETLSGAGKGVANLAIRLALGQVLTKAVFPVVMLDEIDASFDDARAAYTAACLKRLTSTYKQVLLVSHKAGLEADHFIQL